MERGFGVPVEGVGVAGFSAQLAELVQAFLATREKDSVGARPGPLAALTVCKPSSGTL